MNSFIIAKLNVRRTIGSRKGFISLVLLPVLVVSVIIGLFGQTSDEIVPLAVKNEDGNWLSDEVVASVLAVETYRVSEPKGDLEQLKQEAYEGKWGAVIYIPPGFTDKLLRNESASVQLFRKNEQMWNVSLGMTITETTERIARNIRLAALANPEPSRQAELVRELLKQQRDNGPIIAKEHLVKRFSNTFVLVIGLMLMFVMMMVNQSIHGVMEDRGNRTMLRIYSAPVRTWEIALGNFLGCMTLGTLQLLAILILSRYIIGFDIGIPFGKLLVIMEFFLLAAVGISTAAAGIIKNYAQLSSINNLIVIPTCMISGCFWPVSLMPDFMQKLSNFMPQRWAIVALEEVSSGAALSEVALHIGILLLFGIVLLAYGAAVLKPAQN
ncbi:ABC transporter permease [Cohnella cholangitidis]|uniref:ABC transporter permease n=1 Tax=Cohnella cholangitidis TaxID=2598458 RepID=A0A7G5BTN9_9BACL|nr:ABC transporter permease [Cohnella cholangitidis]QMV40323.1 ABC transporter permease [Cohnella cholangitidis]